MLTFTYEATYDDLDETATRQSSMTVDSDQSADFILKSFGNFLKSVGFNITGYLEINDNEPGDFDIKNEFRMLKALLEHDIYISDDVTKEDKKLTKLLSQIDELLKAR